MAFLTKCEICGVKYPYDYYLEHEDCPNGCKAKAKAERVKHYDKYERNKESKSFYNSKQWIRFRKVIVSNFNGMDIYELMENNCLCSGKIVHHIEELTECPNKALDENNMILVSQISHNYIHSIYNKSEHDKKNMQRLLKQMVKEYNIKYNRRSYG